MGHESVSTATNECARIDHQPSRKSLSARNEPSIMTWLAPFFIRSCLVVLLLFFSHCLILCVYHELEVLYSLCVCVCVQLEESKHFFKTEAEAEVSYTFFFLLLLR